MHKDSKVWICLKMHIIGSNYKTRLGELEVHLLYVDVLKREIRMCMSEDCILTLEYRQKLINILTNRGENCE